MSVHFIKKCVHGDVISQCRCPSADKRVEIVPCKHPAGLLEANMKTLDSMVLEGATDVGNPLGYPRTPGEFAARWNGFSVERRQEFLDALIRESSIAALHKQMCRLTIRGD